MNHARLGFLVRRGTALVALTVGLLSIAFYGHASADEMLFDIVEAVVVAAPDNAPQQQQFRAQLEPMLKVELSFVNRVCKLTDDERRLLIAKSNDWLDEFAGDFAKRGGQFQNGQVLFNNRFGRGGRNIEDSRESIQAGVGKLVGSHLPKEKAALYVEECRKRSEFHQKMAVQNIIAQMDKDLMLAPPQREKLTVSLTRHWDKNWAPQAEMFIHGMNLRPNVPDQWIGPHLTPAQQAVWSRRNRASGQMFFGQVVGMDGQVIDDIDLKEGQEAKPEAKPE